MTLDDMLSDLVRRVVREELAVLKHAAPADEYLSTLEAARIAKVVPTTIRR